MEVKTVIIEDVTVVDLAGEVDAVTAPKIQQQILQLAQPGSKILMDMSKVPYMSSAGLRMLLSVYRQAVARNGKLVLVGLSEDIKDTMSVTGFLDFFTTFMSRESGLKALK